MTNKREKNEMTSEMNTSVLGRRGIASLLAVVLVAIPAGLAQGNGINIDLALETVTPSVFIGDTIEVELWFVSSGDPSQDWIAGEVLIEWDEALDWLGYVDNPALSLQVSASWLATPNDPQQMWWGGTGSSPLPAATGDGTLVTTLQFLATDVAVDAPITVMAADGVGPTIVLAPTGLPVTGDLGGSTVTIDVPEPGTVVLMLVGGLLGFRRRRAA